MIEEIIAIRRDIHKHPEIKFDVERTAGIAANAMEDLGLSVETGIGKTGVVADLVVEGAKHTIVLRADMDALPMDEENDLEYRSVIPGRAHMCGHDAHTAMLIGAARALVEKKQALRHNVRFLFQPSEEALPGGAPGMIADGALEGADEVYALHVWPWLKTGVIGICEGPCMAQADVFEVKINGVGGHAAAPHETCDPILMAAQLTTLFQGIVSRSVSPVDSAVVSVTQIHGGTADNVIPGECILNGTVRTYSKSVQACIEDKLRSLAKGVAEAHGGSVEVTYEYGYPPVINHPDACHVVRSRATAEVIYPAEKALFGEDFAYYGEKVPGCFIQLGCRGDETGPLYPLHHPRFSLDEACLEVGIQTFVEICTR